MSKVLKVFLRFLRPIKVYRGLRLKFKVRVYLKSIKVLRFNV